MSFYIEHRKNWIRTLVWGGREGDAQKVRMRIHREGGTKIPIFLRMYLMNGPLVARPEILWTMTSNEA